MTRSETDTDRKPLPDVIQRLLPPLEPVEKGTRVRSRDGSMVGKATGGRSRCRRAGCAGTRLHVKCPDGTLTKPCTTAMHRREDGAWQID